ncbi:hypothetical protein FHR70_003871 [Microvirga lupini]|uniref:Uncharacterized protein n=1 Tax=Microvirga lupini TaxID=420324 RepID=A0A7W4YZ83_9HYPH|nr:hypothetical protein [Microvirga lupini]
MNPELRPATPADAEACGRIIFDAFRGIADQHGFPWDFPSVVITIEYAIREADVVAFLAVMEERRRIRRRDGARHWTLLRDLENPEIWIERYHNPTWLDYVRHNQRMVLFRKNGEHFLYEAGGSPCPRHALRKSFGMRLFGSP